MKTKSDFRKLFPVSDAVFAQVDIYHALLEKWNKAINIVSPKSLPESWHRHFIDSAQVSQFIPEGTKIYADLGCGGGFPGLVVAMMRPELIVHLVESDERKGQFMRTVIREAGLKNVTVHTKRVEDVTGDFTPDLVSARALKSLEELFDFVMPWAVVNPALKMIFMKGEKAEGEIAKAQERFDFTVQTHPSITDSQARILVVHSLACLK
jgi:16S rRNA (guanine527-N7)-methyltransferase